MTGQVKLYGISNCDTIKRARGWLEDQGIEFEFYDYRRQGLEPALLQSMVSILGWEAMLNRRGSSWRALPEDLRNSIDLDSAMRIMLDNPAIIKRPILALDGRLHLGFSTEQYQEIFA